MQASYCGGFQRGKARALGMQALALVARGPSSCGSRTKADSAVVPHGLGTAHGIFSGPGIKPVTPALAGGFSITGPPKEVLISLLTYRQYHELQAMLFPLSFQFLQLYLCYCVWSCQILGGDPKTWTVGSFVSWQTSLATKSQVRNFPFILRCFLLPKNQPMSLNL